MNDDDARPPGPDATAADGVAAEEGVEPTAADDGSGAVPPYEALVADDDTLQTPLAIGGAGSLDQFVAVGLFVGLNSTVGLAWAVIAATLWSIKIAATRRRRGQALGKFLPIVLGYLILRGTAGVVTDSEAVYFGIGIASKIVIGVVLLGSVVIGRNLASTYVPLVLPFDRQTRRHPLFDSTMARLTVLAALFELISSAWDIWLFNNSSANGFVLIRFAVGWPLGTAVIIGGFLYAHVRLNKIPGFEGLPAMLERVAEAQGRPVSRPPEG